MATPVSLDQVTLLSLDPGAAFVVRGLVRSSLDGSSFDAVFQWDGLAHGAWRSGGLFDLAAGGLRIVEQHSEQHTYVLASTGTPGPACAAIGAESPCLVPRATALAHERLRTARELFDTLSGSVEAESVMQLPVGPAARELAGTLTIVGAALAVALAAAFTARHVRRRSRTLLGRVRTAARDAVRATRGDVTLEPLRRHVRAMLERAAELDIARRACARRLTRIDVAALEEKRDACAHSSAPESAEALAWIAAECEEGAQVGADHAASVLGMERIESALRVMVLRVREHRGTRVRARRGNPVDAAAAELVHRDEALADVDRASGI